MPELVTSIFDQVRLTTLIDIGITGLLIYWLFSLIRGTRAVRLVIGVSVLFGVYFLAQAFNLRLLTQILQTGAVVGLFALVVVFQPELRRALERIGRVGSFGWLVTPAAHRSVDLVAREVSRAAAVLSRDRHGALMVLERETGLEEIAESGVMLHADLSADLLLTIFWPKTALHDGAVIVRNETIIAAAALLPLAETTIHTERFGTRHRAALGITEQTDAICVVVSEENGQISLVERARIVRNLTEAQLARSLRSMLLPIDGRSLIGGTAILRRGRRARASGLTVLLGRGGNPRPSGAGAGPGAAAAGAATAGAAAGAAPGGPPPTPSPSAGPPATQAPTAGAPTAAGPTGPGLPGRTASER